MALIKCPECNSDISNLSNVCIHCGFPISKHQNSAEINNLCAIYGQDYDLSEIRDCLLDDSIDEVVAKNDCINSLVNSINEISLLDADLLVSLIKRTGEIPRKYERSKAIPPKKHNDQIHCPRCFSTQITTGARGFSIVTGFMGANKTVNRCAKCGHTWKPKK